MFNVGLRMAGSGHHRTQQATPTFNPVAGTYSGTQNVTISSTGADAIYYTTNGSTPTRGSTLYTTPVSVAVSETLKALAIKAGFVDSAIGSAVYVINSVTILFSSDGSSFSGWTQTGGTVDGAVGNPAPSYSFTPFGGNARISAGVAVTTTILFDVLMAANGICNFQFGGNTGSGSAPGLRLDTRAGQHCGFFAASSWGGGSNPTTAITGPFPSGAWHAVKIVIDGSGNSSWYLDTILQGTGGPAILGTWIGMNGDFGASGGHFDNITVETP